MGLKWLGKRYVLHEETNTIHDEHDTNTQTKMRGNKIFSFLICCMQIMLFVGKRVRALSVRKNTDSCNMQIKMTITRCMAHTPTHTKCTAKA